MPRRTATTETRDQQAHELRYLGAGWAAIAEQLGFAGESTARAAANRHADRIGIIRGVDARRAAAGRYAANRRHNPDAAAARLADATITPVTQALRKITERTFGAEIEFTGKYKVQAARDIAFALQAANIPHDLYMGQPHVHCMPYHGDTCETCGVTLTEKYRHWRIERDGSVTQFRNGEFGGEVVSPILTLPDFNHVEVVLKALRDETEWQGATYKAKVTDACGLHIHADVRDLTRVQRANVVKTWYGLTNVIATFVAGNRHNNHFCAQMPVNEIRQVAHLLENDNRSQSAFNATTNKYRSLNVLPFPKIGTFEFRIHQGTLNATKVRQWVTLLLAFVEGFATETVEQHPTDIQTVKFLDTLITKTDATQKLKTFYLKRQQQFAPEVAAQRATEVITTNDERLEF